MASRSKKGRFIKSTEAKRRDACKELMSKFNSRSKILEEEPAADEFTQTQIWSRGERRVIEPATVVDSLMKGCEMCGDELRLTRTVSETVCGLGSILYIKAIVSHMYDCHDLCNVGWCKYLQNPRTYIRTMLLTNSKLKEELETILCICY